MVTREDFAMLVDEAKIFFDSLPFDARFVFKWYKGEIKPLNAQFSLVTDSIPAFIVPGLNSQTLHTDIGSTAHQPGLEVAIPKQFGETIYLNGITYNNGIQINDMLQDMEGKQYIVRNKQRRGYGAYYVLGIQEYKGTDNTWVEGQVHV